MILDAFSEVYVWVGSGSNDLEKKMAMETAVVIILLKQKAVNLITQEYVKQSPDKRDSDTPIYRIAEGEETFSFTCHFHAWEANKVASTGVKEKRAELVKDVLQGYNKKYTYEQLLKKPPGVDASKLEVTKIISG
jgi:hypothetical protein